MQVTSELVTESGHIVSSTVSDDQRNNNDDFEESILIKNAKNNINNNNIINNKSDIEQDDQSIEVTIINDNHNNNNNNINNININNKRNSPISENSHNISIVSLDDDDSSIASDSDIDTDDLPSASNNYCIENIMNGGCSTSNGLTTYHDDCNNKNGTIILSQNLQNDIASSSKPNIGSIAVQNSTDITFGNKTFYQGPVTIKQFLLENNKWRANNGQDNQGYQHSNGDIPVDNNQDSETKTVDPVKKFLKKKSIIWIGLASFVVVVLLLAGTLVYLLGNHGSINSKTGDGDDGRKNIPINSNIDASLPNSVSRLRLVSRAEWIAQPPNEELTDLELPINRVIIAHSATENCTTQATCTFRIRYIQTFHMESRGWDDIGYNFMVGGDGNAYEARGWDKQGAHTFGYNTGSICIAFIGTFTKYPPNKRQLDAAKLLIEEGVRLNKLTANYKLYGHRQFMATESPGDALFNIIKEWPHFTETSNQ